MKILYNLTFSVFAFFYLPFFVLRLRQEKNKWRLIRQRFGFFSRDFLSALQGRKVVWVHAVSVGEVYAARPLVDRLEKALPEWRLAVSTVTPTGQAIARKLFPGAPVFYFPFDLSGVVKRTLERIRPSLLILIETEIWPNLILAARESGVPVGIVNGRISPRSHHRYVQIRSLIREVLERICFFLVQSQWDSDRLQEMGVDVRKITVTGNMKLDGVYDVSREDVAALKAQFQWNGKEKIIVAGSTHEGEEKILINVLRKLRFEFPNLKLVIAPRHVTRAPKIARLIADQHFRCQLRSASAGAAIEDILVLDTMGELKMWYGLADLVFVGGSLVKHGGQNPIEAAIFRKPIFFGPHVFNFQVIYDKITEEKAGFQVFNETELYDFIRRMLLDSSSSKSMGLKAYELVGKLQGATQRNADYILHFLKDGGSLRLNEEVSVAQ